MLDNGECAREGMTPVRRPGHVISQSLTLLLSHWFNCTKTLKNSNKIGVCILFFEHSKQLDTDKQDPKSNEHLAGRAKRKIVDPQLSLKLVYKILARSVERTTDQCRYANEQPLSSFSCMMNKNLLLALQSTLKSKSACDKVKVSAKSVERRVIPLNEFPLSAVEFHRNFFQVATTTLQFVIHWCRTMKSITTVVVGSVSCKRDISFIQTKSFQYLRGSTIFRC